MKLSVGNGCWHAGHVQDAAVALEAGYFAQEGIDVEIVHAKINPQAISSSRPGGERYDEVGTVVRDMIAYGIDIFPTSMCARRSPSAPWATMRCESSAAGAANSAASLVTAPGIKSLQDFAANASATGIKAASPRCGSSSKCVRPRSIRSTSGVEDRLQVRLAARGLEAFARPAKPTRPSSRTWWRNYRSVDSTGFTILSRTTSPTAGPIASPWRANRSSSAIRK